MKKEFDVCLIAAGEGSRLKSEGINCSKPLIQINGKPLIERLFAVLEKYSVLSVNCIINEESDDLLEFINNYNFESEFNLTVKSTPSSFHSFAEVGKFVKAGHFLLATVDSVFHENEFDNFINTYFNSAADLDGLMSVTNYIDDEKPLCAEFNKEKRIVKLSDNREGCEFATGGIYLFNKNVLKEVNTAVGNGTNRLRNYLRLLIEKEYRLFAFPFSTIIDVDHTADIKKAEKLLRNN